MIRPVARILGVAALLLLAVALVAQARPRTLREFGAAYPKIKGKRLDACITCHTSSAGVTLNPYGTSLQKARFNFITIEKEDSDADGSANRKEIDLLSFPGDASDKPGARRDSVAADSTVRRDSTAVGRDSTAALPDTLKKK